MAIRVGAILFLQLIGVSWDIWFIGDKQGAEEGFFARFECQVIRNR